MKRRLRVLYVDNSVGFGGAIKSLSLTLRQLPEVEALVMTSQEPDIVSSLLHGHRVWTFRRVVNYRSLEQARHRIEQRVRIKPLRQAIFKAMAGLNLSITFMNVGRMAWFLRHHRIDLVHLNNGFLPNEALLATHLLKIPCVVHFRNFYRARHEPHYPLRHVLGAIAVSNAVAASVHFSVFPQEKITTVYNPVDLDLVATAAPNRERVRGQLGLKAEHLAFGIFGRVIPWKGQLIFVEAAIRAMRKDPNVRAVIIGDESDGGVAYIDSIRATIRDSGMEDRFLLPGYTSEVESYYAAMDVVVHASITPEPFGRVVPEGMAAGRVVIAADAGGPCELITHGVDGLLVPPSDVEALAEAMQTLAANEELRHRLAAAAYRTAHERFGIEATAVAVRRVYDELLSGWEKRSGEVGEQVIHPESAET